MIQRIADGAGIAPNDCLYPPDDLPMRSERVLVRFRACPLKVPLLLMTRERSSKAFDDPHISIQVCMVVPNECPLPPGGA